MENFLPELNFLGVERHAKRDVGYDVSLTLVNTNNSERISISFRNDTADIIAPNCSKISLAPCKNRIFFKEDEKTGYKASAIKSVSNSTKYMRASHVDMLKAFIGDYELKYDKYYELYYIEKEVE